MQGLSQGRVHVNYSVADFTRQTDLLEGHYDLAFCDFVLHHVWYDPQRAHPLEDTAFAISEMARVVRPEGYVAAFELIQYDNKPTLDFQPLFDRAGLQQSHYRQTMLDRATIAEFLYVKPSV